MIINPDKFLIPQFSRLKGRMQVVLKEENQTKNNDLVNTISSAHLDVQIRGAVAVGADQDPVALAAQQLLDGAAQGERLSRPVWTEDDDGRQDELQGRGDGSHGLPLLGVEPLVHLGQLPAVPLRGRVPGYRGSAGLSQEKSVRKQLLWRGKNSNFNNFTLSQLRSNSNYPIFLKTF